MNDNDKMVWCTAFNAHYYHAVFSKVIDTWQHLRGDQWFYADEAVDSLADDQRVRVAAVDFTKLPHNISGKESKFWRKSLCVAHAVRESQQQNYDYCIWLDADVSVNCAPAMECILPDHHEILSVVHKITPGLLLELTQGYLGLDTGYLAINLHHPKLDQWLHLYEDVWYQPVLQDMQRKYDTYTLYHVLQEMHIPYRNLWNGTYGTGKTYCGFEGTNLEKSFYHYWGKKRKSLLAS